MKRRANLIDLRARQYDPHLRIFVSPDPLGYVDSFDLWQYVGGDPLNRWDPFGLQLTDEATWAAEEEEPETPEFDRDFKIMAASFAVGLLRSGDIVTWGEGIGTAGGQVFASVRDLQSHYERGTDQFPAVLCLAHLSAFESEPMKQSRHVVVWHQDRMAPPFDPEAVEFIRKLDWKAVATDASWWEDE